MRRSAPLLLAAGLLAAALSGAPVAAAPSPTGCSGRPAAVAYHPGSGPVTPTPRGAPAVCGFGTGFAAAESHIVVTGSGTVVYTPAVVPSGVAGAGSGPGVADTTQGNATPAGIATSADGGARWSLVEPDGVTWNPTDHGEYVDPRSGRFLFEDYGPIPLAPSLGPDQEGPAYISWSDDLRSWHHSVILGLTLPENPRFTSGVAPVGHEPPARGYPSVLYFCANSNVGFTSPAILARFCYRSLDGGTTWTQRSQLLNALTPQHTECGQSGENITAVDGYYPVTTRDGTLFTLISCGNSTYLAQSTDEAATFPILHTASGPVSLALPIDSVITLNSGPQLRIDAHDTFYVVYPNSALSRLMLITSTDRGRTWAHPRDITPPGVASILRWSVAVRGAGQLALSLVAQRAGQTTYDAVLAYTANATAANPLLWSAVTNTVPVLYANHIAGAGNIVLGQGQVAVPYPFPLGIQPAAGIIAAGADFIGVTIGPDGTVWGSFDADCGPTADSAGCVATRDQTRGFVGALRPHVAPRVRHRAAHPTKRRSSGGVHSPRGGLAATGLDRWSAGLGAIALVGAALLEAARRHGRGREHARR